MEFHIWRTFRNRVDIHLFKSILLCFDTFLYAKMAGHSKNGLRIGVSLLVLKLGPSQISPFFQLFPAQKCEFLLNRGFKQGFFFFFFILFQERAAIQRNAQECYKTRNEEPPIHKSVTGRASRDLPDCCRTTPSKLKRNFFGSRRAGNLNIKFKRSGG